MNQAYQPPIDRLTLLAPPTLSDVVLCSALARRTLIRHAGRVAESARGLFQPHPPSDEGVCVEETKVRDAHGVIIPCSIVSFVSDDTPPDMPLGNALLDWAASPEDFDQDSDAEIPYDDAKYAAIVIDFNRRWSAFEWMQQSAVAFLDLFECIAHEVGHIKDREHTVKLNTYDEVQGRLSEHRYLFDPTEMRARVWAALTMYSHMYIHACEGAFNEPLRDSPDSAWWDMCMLSRLKAFPIDELNVDNQRIFMGMLKDVACNVRDEWEHKRGRSPLPPTMNVIQEAKMVGAIPERRKAVTDQQQRQMLEAAAKAMANFCLIEWQTYDSEGE